MKGNCKRIGIEKMDPKVKRSQKCHWRIKWPTNEYLQFWTTTIKLPTLGHSEEFLSTFGKCSPFSFVRSVIETILWRRRRKTKFTVSKIRSQKIWILKAMNKKSTAFADIHISAKIHSTRWREYTITRCLIHKEDCICCSLCSVPLTDWIEYIRSKRNQRQALLNKLNKFWKQTLSGSH